MEEKYIEDIDIKELNEREREKEIVKNIIKAKEDLKKANLNFEFAEFDLIDYYIYQIKAIQAKLDYLIKMAKIRNIEINKFNELEIKIEMEENKAG